jgi:oleate hydratase
MMPFIASQFMPRVKGDRPDVVPEGAKNFAFIGQFCEIPDDVVFTVEYSVRSALIAVYMLLDIKKEIPPVFKG